MPAGQLGPQVGAGVRPGARRVPGEGGDDPHEGGGEYPAPAAALSPAMTAISRGSH